MKVILVDDEPIALEVLGAILSTYEDIDILRSYTDPIVALKELKELQPDVIFLDIEMGATNGLEMAQLFLECQNSVEIVFITAYSQYAVDAFDVNAMDYLLKPIQEKRFYKTIERLRERTEKHYIQDKKTNVLENKLKIKSFGVFKVLDSFDNPLIWRTQKTKELFAYLWEQNDRHVSKDLIMETIFPDKDLDKATTLLHTTIYQLRKNLGKLGYPNGILYFNDSYQLKLPITSDLEELNSILELKSLNDKDILRILDIYKGDFLENEGYHWAIGIQQMYKDLVFNLLYDFSKIKLGKRNFTSILRMCLDMMYKLDPFNDNVAKMIIEYYGSQGKKSKLETFFNNYVENLWKEMNLRPLDSTNDLYRKYLKK